MERFSSGPRSQQGKAGTCQTYLWLEVLFVSCLRTQPSASPSPARMLHMDRRILQNAVRNILDGELLNRYLYLSTMERSELAKKIGTTPDIVSGRGEGGRGKFPSCSGAPSRLMEASSCPTPIGTVRQTEIL